MKTKNIPQNDTWDQIKQVLKNKYTLLLLQIILLDTVILHTQNIIVDLEKQYLAPITFFSPW